MASVEIFNPPTKLNPNRMKNETKQLKVEETLSLHGWTVNEVAEKLKVTHRSIYLAFSAFYMAPMRRKIENLVGKPIFCSPIEFERRQKTIKFFGADVETLLLREAVAIAERIGVILPLRRNKSIVFKALQDYELIHNPALNPSLQQKNIKKFTQEADVASETIKTFIASSTCAVVVDNKLIQETSVASGIALRQAIDQCLAFVGAEADEI